MRATARTSLLLLATAVGARGVDGSAPHLGLFLALYNANVTTDWKTVASAAKRVPLRVVVVPPGVPAPDPDWAPAFPSAAEFRAGVQMLQRSGAHVHFYVHFRNVSQACCVCCNSEAQLRRWIQTALAAAPFDGIFLDNMDMDINPYTGHTGLELYTSTVRYAKAQGLEIWSNGPQVSSTEPVPCEPRRLASACGANASLWRPYLELSSFTTLFEMPYASWVGYSAHKSLSAALDWPASKLGGLVLDTPDTAPAISRATSEQGAHAAVDRAVDLALSRQLGWISVTGVCHASKTSGCTYAQLPTFWDALVAKIAALNLRGVGRLPGRP